MTPFQAKIYAALGEIPRGKVVTYGVLARRVSCGSAQAVGQALRRNPHAPEVPCHRVVAADRSLGGYAGERGGEKLAQKRRLLASEGVVFEEGNERVATGSLWDWPAIKRVRAGR
ncbi:MAG: MGMT family protein [Verrucomicrobiales bacterium]